MKKGKYRPKYKEKQQQPPEGSTSTTLPKNETESAVYSEQVRLKPTIRQPRPKHYVEKHQSQKSDECCLICSQHIQGKDAVWNCKCCYKYMHLKCIKKWILNCNKEGQKAHLLTWSCPQCKYEYLESMPEYYCFCEKYKNPQYDRDLPPHTCGNFCQKKRGVNCPHPCPSRCHAGKCPPCSFQGLDIECCCGKSTMKIKCSDQLTHFVCPNKCEKLLGCRKHNCKKTCHTGPCPQCTIKHMSACFCGKNEDVIDCQLDSYSCQQQCGKTLDCGNHTCKNPCHKGGCQPCQRKPEISRNCPCGQFDLMMLMSEPRKSCLDPIPVCGMPCKKKLECGHNCTKSCHEGPCSRCKIGVTQTCSCTSSIRKAQCWMLTDDAHMFECEKICKKKLSCGVHSCQTVCCSGKYNGNQQDHQCHLTCKRMFECGKHQCGMPCHTGNCGRCPILHSQPQFCPCGGSSLRPPIPCGVMVPECGRPCDKELSCGHICKLSCHYGECKCGEKVSVKCQCGKNMIETDCGRSALCVDKCPNVLPCGHVCQIQCHAAPCPTDCQKICRKTRPNCGHICLQRCHPSTQCVAYPCETETLIRCECGHRQKMVPCGSTEVLLQKHIACNKTCENVKRFKVLYSGKDVYYPSTLVYFGLKNFKYLQKLQQTIETYIKSEREDPMHIEFKFGNDQTIKMSMQVLFEKHYHLDAYFSPHRKSPFFTVLKTKNTMIPSPNLNFYITLVGKGEIKKNNVPFQASLRFAPMTKDKSDILEGYLAAFSHKYYPERKDKAYYMHFWLSDHAEAAFDLVSEKYTSYPCTYQIHTDNIPVDQYIDASQVIAEEATEKTQKAQTLKNTQEKPKEVEVKIEDLERSKKQVEELQRILSKPTGLKKVYPPSSQFVQSIYKLDDHEQMDKEGKDKTHWELYGDEMASKELGREATEWRARAYVIMKGIFGVSKPQWLSASLKRLMTMYKEQKSKARRLLSHRSVDFRSAEGFLIQNGINLSNDQPQFTSYYILDTFISTKETVEVEEQLLKAQEVTLALQVVDDVQAEDSGEFVKTLASADFMDACSLLPFRETMIRSAFDQMAKKGKKFQLGKIMADFMFATEASFTQYLQTLHYHLEQRPSKKDPSVIRHILVKNQQALTQEQAPFSLPLPQQVSEKRDSKYCFQQPQEVVLDTNMCHLSYFAFGDHKSPQSTYINRLLKTLRR